MLKIKTRNLIITAANLCLMVGIITLSIATVFVYSNKSGFLINIVSALGFALLCIVLNALRSDSESTHKAIKSEIVSISLTAIYVLAAISFCFYLFIEGINALLPQFRVGTINYIMQRILGVAAVLGFVIGSVLSDGKNATLLVSVCASLLITVSGITFVTMYFSNVPLGIIAVYSPVLLVTAAYLVLKKTPLRNLKLCKAIF